MEFKIKKNGQEVAMKVKGLTIEKGDFSYYEVVAKISELTALGNTHVSEVKITDDRKGRLMEFVSSIVQEQVEEKIKSQQARAYRHRKNIEIGKTQEEIDQIKDKLHVEQEKRKDEYKQGYEFQESLNREAELNAELREKGKQLKRLNEELDAIK